MRKLSKAGLPKQVELVSFVLQVYHLLLKAGRYFPACMIPLRRSVSVLPGLSSMHNSLKTHSSTETQI